MAITVDNAFSEFMYDYVNLDATKVGIARRSRDNIINQIHALDSQYDFFNLYNNYDEKFGSFERKTKIRELDDIDFMIGINSDSSTYQEFYDRIEIYVQGDNSPQKNYCNDGTNVLNSTKVLNKFKSKISNFGACNKAEIRSRGEAVTLSYSSYDWVFDIVPCFRTSTEVNGRDYYIIPDGKGNWKKTDPRIDRKKVIDTNQRFNGRVLELIRIVKKWSNVKNAKTMPSYLLETMVINYCDTVNELSKWIDIRFIDALYYVYQNISNPVYDMKNIQGDINNLSDDDKTTLSYKAYSDYQKALDARKFETDCNHQASIAKWKEIFGSDFPKYG